MHSVHRDDVTCVCAKIIGKGDVPSCHTIFAVGFLSSRSTSLLATSILLTLNRLFCLCYPCTGPVYDVSGQRTMGGPVRNICFLIECLFHCRGQTCAQIRDANIPQGPVLSRARQRAKSGGPGVKPGQHLSAPRGVESNPGLSACTYSCVTASSEADSLSSGPAKSPLSLGTSNADL